MAERNRVWPRLLAVLLMGASAATGAQTAASRAYGTLTGKLTDLHSAPLDGATVVVRNEGTGAQAKAKTQKNGSFRLSGLEPGAYTVEAESERLGRGRLGGVVVSAGHEAHVQAAMAFELVAPRPTDDAIAAPAFDPLRELAEMESRAAAFARERTSTETQVGSGRLDAETLRRLPLIAQPLPSEARVAPSTETQALAGAVTSELLETLNLSGPGKPGTGTGRGPSNGQLVAPAVVGAAAASEAAALGAEAAIASVPAGAKQGSAGTARVDPVTEAVATTITATELQSLPAAGRRWQDFELDTPTAATAAGGDSPTLLRGAGQEPPETSMDGVSTRMAFGEERISGPESQGSAQEGVSGRNRMAPVWAGGHGSPVAEAAISEVRMVAGNAESEGARTAGGHVSVETARGTNGLHGQGFLFDRQNTWGAQNPYTQWITKTSESAPLAPFNNAQFPVFDNFKDSPGQYGAPESYTPPDHESVWGIGVGSQIRRDKLFWFATLDSYNRNDPGLSMVKHPYLAQTPSPCESTPCTPTITGFFAQPSTCQLQMLSARLGLASQGSSSDGCVNGLVQGVTAYSQMLETLDGLLGPAPRTAQQWTGFGRFDWQAAERHRFTLEGIGARWNSPGGGLTGLSENFGNHSFGSSKASEELLLGRWEAFLTPNLLAVTQGSVGRNILSARASTPSAFEQTFLGPNAYGQLPEIVVDNRYGFTIGNPSRFGQGSYPDERLYQAQESVDWVRGSLLVKAGFDLSHNFDATSLLRNQTGTYTYSNVENFVSDALVFANYGIAALNFIPSSPENSWHNCDNTGTVWQDSTGQLEGGGYLPCYSYYSQTLGPANWNLSTNDWAGFTTMQWQPRKLLVVSGGLRWEREQLPPPIAALNNPELPLTEKLPGLGNDWGPRISVALGNLERHWPVLRVGYGMYFGRTENATVETALTQTGSPNGDLNFFMRPTDDCQFCAGGAPPFPYVLRGPPGSEVKPGAVEFAPNFRNPEVHQAVAAVEEELPGHVEVTASAMVSLGRRLPVYVDMNIDLAGSPQAIIYGVTPNSGPASGPIQTPQTPGIRFYSARLNPDYQRIDQIVSKANSTYEAAMLKVTRFGRRGLSLHAHYTYAHAMDWNPGESPLDPNPANFDQEYGTSSLDMRHSAAAMAIYEAPWKLRNLPGKLANGWTVSSIGNFGSGLPYTMRVTGSLPEEYSTMTGEIEALGPGMNGSGGDNRVYGVGRNTYRYPYMWKVDMRLAKGFDLGHMRQLELLVESFNLFNHQNVTELESTGYYIERGSSGELPSLNVLTIPPANITVPPSAVTPAFGQPLNVNATNFYRERQIQFGARMRF